MAWGEMEAVPLAGWAGCWMIQDEGQLLPPPTRCRPQWCQRCCKSLGTLRRTFTCPWLRRPRPPPRLVPWPHRRRPLRPPLEPP